MRTDVSKVDMSKADMCPFLAVLEYSSYWDAVASGMHHSSYYGAFVRQSSYYDGSYIA